MPHTALRPAAAAAVLIACTGCVERTVSITSEPPGAIVWLNDREVGRTPVEVAYVHDGTFDVRLALAGHEPVMTGRDTKPPVWDWPGFDFFAEIAPVPLESRTEWHFVLEPARDEPGPLVERARELRSRVIDDEAFRAIVEADREAAQAREDADTAPETKSDEAPVPFAQDDPPGEG